MTADSPDPPATDQHAPFGTQPPRSKGPLVFLGVLYAGWLVVLVWMAARESVM